MANKPYIDRIVQAAGISEEQASQALVAVFQEFLNAVGEKSRTTIDITPHPTCGTQINVSVAVVVNVPTQPH